MDPMCIYWPKIEYLWSLLPNIEEFVLSEGTPKWFVGAL